MFSLVFASCHYVVKVDKNEIKVVANCVHQTLKSLCCVFQPKKHMKKFMQAERGYDGSLWNVFFLHRNLVVATNEIKL